MALPTVTKTWQYLHGVVTAQADTEATSRLLLRSIKNAMKGEGSGWTDRAGGSITPTGGCTCKSSSDRVAVGNNDDVDRWDADGDLDWVNTGNRSWIVLQQGGLDSGGKFQIMLGLFDGGANSYNLDVAVSHTGFGAANGGADGTLSAYPTTTQHTFPGGPLARFWGGATSNVGSAWTVMLATDGSTRVYIFRNSKIVAEWYFDKLASPQAGWTHPYFARFDGINTAAPTSDLGTVSDWMAPSVAYHNKSWSTVSLTLGTTAEGTNAAPLFNTLTGPNAFSGEYPTFGVGIYSSASSVGRHALMADLWFGLTALATGQCYPLTPSETREFAQFGFRVVPWDGTVPVLVG